MPFRKKLVEMIGARLFLNILFWMMVFIVKAPSVQYVGGYSIWVYYGLIIYFLMFLALLSYVHNGIILPRFFFQKKYLLYFSFSFIWLFVVSYVYVLNIKWLSNTYPGLEAMRMSVVMSPLTPDTSFSGVLNDLQTYFFIMLMWLFIFALLGIYYQTRQTMRNMEQALLLHREAELSFLKSQLNPHFLFNTLNNLYGLALLKHEQTPEVLLKLSSVLRYLLYESNAPLVSIETEKEILFSYIDLELLRLNLKENPQFSVSTDKDYQVPPLLWLPILENVFKHTRNIQDPQISFSLSIYQNQLLIISKNRVDPNAISNKPIEASGIGMQNLQKRLTLLYPKSHQIEVQQTQDFYQIQLQLNLAAHA
jgi:two-component system, LytTR family, sensor kinase